MSPSRRHPTGHPTGSDPTGAGLSRRGLLGLTAFGGLGALGTAGCSPSGSAPPAPSTAASGPTPAGRSGAVAMAAEATSAEALGGPTALVSAARREGELNVISLEPDWVDYGRIISAFESRYGVRVTSRQPEASSQEEIDAVNGLRGRPEAPDVLDLGLAVARANTHLFAPYRVQTWNDIPQDQKEPSGLWVQDYGGFMSIGYNADVVPDPTSVADLLKSPYRNAIALTGNPNQSNTALNAVMMAAIAVGGSAEDVTKGIEFFGQLSDRGNLLPVQASLTTIRSGQTPVVLDWDYITRGVIDEVPRWQIYLPSNALLSSYYAQAVNADAPHPAAARLWQEFLFSDEGQNLFLGAGARPVRLAAMKATGTADASALARLPVADGERPIMLTEDQVAAARRVLATTWSSAIS